MHVLRFEPIIKLFPDH